VCAPITVTGTDAVGAEPQPALPFFGRAVVRPLACNFNFAFCCIYSADEYGFTSNAIKFELEVRHFTKDNAAVNKTQ
jgi:hypothetical protein